MAAIDHCPVQAGDGPFEALYLRHKPAVYRTALRHLGNRDDAEDITQETFLSAYRALARGTRPTSPRAWLLTIARNACRARFRKHSRQGQEAPLGAEIELVSTDQEMLVTSEVRAALAELQPKQRSVFLLREVVGLSFPEIADRLGQSESSVQALFFRARATMREELEAARAPLSCSAARELLDSGFRSAEERDRHLLRAHLRGCRACALEARRRRARRTALGILTGPLHRLADWLGLSSAAPSAKLGTILGAAAIAAGVVGQPGSGPSGSESLVKGTGGDRAARAMVADFPTGPGPATQGATPSAFANGLSAAPPDRRGGREQGPPASSDQARGKQPPAPSPVEPGGAGLGPGDTTPTQGAHGSAIATPDRRGDPGPSPADAPALVEQVTEGVTELIPALPDLALPEVELSLPAVNVTVPEVSVPVPEGSVTLPELTVTAPEVSVTAPEVSLSVPDVDLPELPLPAGGSLLPPLP